MTVIQMTKRVALLAMGGMLVLSTGGGVLAFNSHTDLNTDMDPVNGFDPTNLVTAATAPIVPISTNTGVLCLRCPNGGNAGGTTAGALTDRFFGGVRTNATANTGPSGRNPSLQGQTIPSSGVNNSGAFVVSTPSAGQNFLAYFDPTGTGGAVANPQPTTDLDGDILGPGGQAVGTGGVRLAFSNDFTYNADGTTKFDQTIDQATFTGGLGNDAVQLVRLKSNSGIMSANESVNDSGTIAAFDLEQTIVEGGFVLAGDLLFTTGQITPFAYNAGNFDQGDAPTGLGQSNGTTNLIGGANTGN